LQLHWIGELDSVILGGMFEIPMLAYTC